MNTTAALQIFRNVQNIFRIAATLQLTAHWCPQPACVSNGAIYDYVIVGGGTAGCVIASRLVEMKNVKVLLIEAGGNPPLESTYPGYYAAMKRSNVDWNLTSIEEPYTQNQRNKVVTIPQGKMLGGSSSLSYMTYVRGDRTDYDSWASLTNDSSWSYKSILPYFIKTEKLIDKKVLASPEDKALHGTKGRLKIRKFYYNKTEKYYGALKELGYKIVVDINSRNPLGFTDLMYTCDEKVRQSTAYAYLRHVKDNPSLHVLTHALVTKINFKGNTAVGVEIRTKNNKILNVKAKREVILTAGVFKTPQLLMLSGIGPKQHLESKGIEVRRDLPVGKKLLDHPVVLSVFKIRDQKRVTLPVNPNVIGYPALDGFVKLDENKNVPGNMIVNKIIDNAVMFLQLCAVVSNLNNEICDTLYNSTIEKEIDVVYSHFAYPKSHGEVLLNSTNIQDNPVIRLGLYSYKEDIQMHARYLMHYNSIFNTTFFKEVGAEFVNPKLKNCPKLEMDSMEYWMCYVLAMASTQHYNAGTCAMGTVVDSRLLVKGFNRLRVADASIMPTITSSPIISTVIMVAEKASDMIKENCFSKL